MLFSFARSFGSLSRQYRSPQWDVNSVNCRKTKGEQKAKICVYEDLNPDLMVMSPQRSFVNL